MQAIRSQTNKAAISKRVTGLKPQLARPLTRPRCATNEPFTIPTVSSTSSTATATEPVVITTSSSTTSSPQSDALTSSSPAAAVAPPPQPITLTDKALDHLKKLKAEVAKPGSGALLLRVGVKSGGCSGMSYQMDFEDRSKVGPDDMVVPYDNGNFELVINPQSLLYLFGMNLDYSDALIGGGFQFQNPNAKDSCGCGKSFGV